MTGLSLGCYWLLEGIGGLFGGRHRERSGTLGVEAPPLEAVGAGAWCAGKWRPKSRGPNRGPNRGVGVNDFEGEAASTRETLRYCVELARPYRRFLIPGAGFLVVAVGISDVASPLVFAAVLDRIATLQKGTDLWARFGRLIVIYAVLIVAGQAAFRMSAWLEWEGALRTFTNGILRSFERLLSLGYRWHIDHPSGEVASSLSAFSWPWSTASIICTGASCGSWWLSSAPLSCWRSSLGRCRPCSSC